MQRRCRQRRQRRRNEQNEQNKKCKNTKKCSTLLCLCRHRRWSGRGSGRGGGESEGKGAKKCPLVIRQRSRRRRWLAGSCSATDLCVSHARQLLYGVRGVLCQGELWQAVCGREGVVEQRKPLATQANKKGGRKSKRKDEKGRGEEERESEKLVTLLPLLLAAMWRRLRCHCV